jgi:hypothetical protein
MSRDITVIPFRPPGRSVKAPLNAGQTLIAEADAFVAQWKD